MSDFIAYIKDAIYFSLIFEDRYQLVLLGLGITLVLTTVSFVLGTLLGMVLCAGMGSRRPAVRVNRPAPAPTKGRAITRPTACSPTSCFRAIWHIS